jgi:peptidyl-tRNA hydrolase, PTH1 family
MKFVIVLLGNPGKAYEYTRHNAARVLFESVKDVPEGFELLTPSTFMNESGLDVVKYLCFHENVNLVVVYDDKDLEMGRIKLAYDRGDGGHNGLKSVMQCLGRSDFLRLRIGIAPHGTDGREKIPPHGDEVQKFVLATFRKDEREALEMLAEKIPDMLTTLRDEGHAKAMEVYNGK